MVRLQSSLVLLWLLGTFSSVVATSNEEGLECASATGTKNGKDTVIIPKEWINDGYCDCPLDGLDEPNTDACSGSSSWPGVLPMNKDASSSGAAVNTFVCPQQPDLILPLSRLNDGICDCCDGVDEPEGVCPDNCEEILREAREARQRLGEAFSKGYNKRKDELFAYKKMREAKLKEVEELEARAKDLDPNSVDARMADVKQEYMTKRITVVHSVVDKASNTYLAGLSSDELQHFLVHACQLAGEMDAYTDNDDACVALRMAGLDLGLTWPLDNHDNVSSMKLASSNTLLSQIADALFTNAADGKRGYNIQGFVGAGRRRLDETWDDDHHYDDDGYYNRYEDDDYTGGGYDDHHDHDRFSSKSPAKELTGAAKERAEGILELPFSITRKAFLARTNEIMDEIKKVEEEKPEETEESEESSKEVETEEESKPTIDPAAYTMVKSNLGRRKTAIERGLRWASSATLFFEANQDLQMDQLQKLAMLTVYHGKLSSVQIWQIFQATVEELVVPPAAEDKETCASPWANSCPPKTIKRKGVSLPSADVVSAADSFCTGQTMLAQTVCSAEARETGPVPTFVPDGYYGYSMPIPRGEQDKLTAAFAPLADLPVDKAAIESLEKEKRSLEKEKKNLEKDITKLWKDVGGKKGDKMGPNGELYGLSDQCFSVEAGKYTYEACVFGQAQQKEGTKKGGTSLGQFKRMDYDAESGARTMFWENGTKCWNGPARSVEVEITCGAETKVLSADEPDTCRYVLQMESHIACDDHYKQKMGL